MWQKTCRRDCGDPIGKGEVRIGDETKAVGGTGVPHYRYFSKRWVV